MKKQTLAVQNSGAVLTFLLADQTDGIEIILDKTRQLSGENLEMYRSENEYFEAYISLQSAIKRNERKRVIVWSKALHTWLVKGLSKYKHAAITARELTFRDLLAAKWKISSFDIELTDVQIQRQKLLDLPVEGVQPLPLSSFVCQLISPYLDFPHLNRGNVGELLTDLLEKYDSHKEQLPGIIHVVYRQKLKGWARTNPEYNDVIQELTEDIRGMYETCCVYKLTAQYPMPFRIKCLGEERVKRLDHAGFDLRGLDAGSFETGSALYSNVLVHELNIFFHSFEQAHPDMTSEQVEELLAYCSGELTQEIEYLLRLLKSHPYLVDNALITRIKRTFTSLLPLYNQKIEEFRAYVAPAKPSPFNPQVDIHTAVKWAIEEYLPYKFWLETTRRTEPEILSYGSAFADYVFERYEQISYHYEKVLYRFLFNYKALIAETAVPILLMIDNFNYKFFPHFQASLAQHALVPTCVEPYFSLLPSETAIAKKALISGKRDQGETVRFGYEKNLIEQWQEYFPNHTLTYLSKAGELDEYTLQGDEFIVINYVEIDAELHKSYQKTAIEHRKAVTFVLEHLSELLANFITRNHLEAKARIFLISDHGSTLIPASLPNEIEPQYFKGQAIDEKHRFLSISDAQFQFMQSNANIAGSVFFLKKEIAGDGKNYIIAKGYNRFKTIQEDFYVHGGALPEEIIVPAGCFEYRTEQWEHLIVQLVKTEYRLLTKETLVVRLANPNLLPVNNILIHIISRDNPLAVIDVQELQGRSERDISQEIRLKQKDMIVLQFDLYYEIAGRSVQETIEHPITIKTMTQARFDFDEW